MEPKLTTLTALPEPKSGPAESPAQAAKAAEAADVRQAELEKAKRDQEPQKASDQVDMRLVIDVDEASGAYVYKTINRQTGEVMSQLPRAEILKLRDVAQYAAGSVIQTKA